MSEALTPPITPVTDVALIAPAITEQVADAAGRVAQTAPSVQNAIAPAQEALACALETFASIQRIVERIQNVAARVQKATRVPPWEGQALRKKPIAWPSDFKPGPSTGTDPSTSMADDEDLQALERELEVLMTFPSLDLPSLISALKVSGPSKAALGLAQK